MCCDFRQPVRLVEHLAIVAESVRAEMTTMLVPLFSGFAVRDLSINVMFKWWNNGSRQLVSFRDSWEFQGWNPRFFDVTAIMLNQAMRSLLPV